MKVITIIIPIFFSFFSDVYIPITENLNAKEFQQPTLDILKRRFEKNSYYTLTLTKGVWDVQLVLYDSLILVCLQLNKKAPPIKFIFKHKDKNCVKLVDTITASFRGWIIIITICFCYCCFHGDEFK